MAARDCWADWLLRRRFGGDAEMARHFLEALERTRDRVLDGAGLAPGETLLDVGCGDGLIAFGALGRGAGCVTFSDVSRDLLDESRRLAAAAGVLDRARFVRAAADDLAAIESGSVDAVTTRSVLIYVAAKLDALREFERVLRPGGRVSLFEPINRRNRFLRAYDPGEVADLAERVMCVFETLQPRDSDPMLDFDDQDLVELAERAGFPRVELTVEVRTEPPEPVPWDTYLDTAWNPRIPSMREVMDDVLSAEERARYAAVMRPLVEAGRGSRRMAAAYLVARKAEPG